MTNYSKAEQERINAQQKLNAFIYANQQVISRYAELINEHMKATNKANKALLEEAKASTINHPIQYL